MTPSCAPSTSCLTYLRSLDKRREEVIALIAGMDKLTPEIEAAVNAARTLTEIEDIYRPFRPHRKTRASVAREKGLEPLAALLLAQEKEYDPPLETQAAAFVSAEKGVGTVEEAFAGACDILAEEISDNAEYRKQLRARTWSGGMLTTARTGEADSVYAQYYAYSEKLSTVPGHRVLAINRGEKEGFLKVEITVNRDNVLGYLLAQTVSPADSPARPYVTAAAADSYDRLIAPSVERELRNDLTDAASEGAIKLFSDNLKHLLMQAPLKGKVVLGFDPGYRTGCKLARCRCHR